MITSMMIGAMLFSMFVLVAAWCGDAVLREFGLQTRRLWFMAIVASVAWIVIAPFVLTTAQSSLGMPIAIGATFTPAVTVSGDVVQPGRSWTVDAYVLAAWIVASTLLTGRLCVAVVRLWRIRRQAAPATVDGHAVLLTTNVGPAVIGGHRGDIVIPRWLLEFDPSLRALVFRHEQEHRDARDPLLLWLSQVVPALLPWNLPLWFIARQLRISLEIDCDARTLARTDDRDRYARLLLLIAQRRIPLPLASTLAGNRSGLSTRIAIMMRPDTKQSKTRAMLFIAIAAIAVVAACSTRIASNLTSPNAPNVAIAADVQTTADAQLTAVDMESTTSAAAAAGNVLFDFQTEKPALALTGKAPVYPVDLRERRIEGQVLAQFVVNEQGIPEPSTVKILKSSEPAFAEAVLTAVPDMRYSPAQAGGRAVKQLVQQRFGFAIN